MAEKYKEMYDKFINYEQNLHQQNQKRIRVGLKINIILPLFFLILSFAISEGKLVFLLLWIISLFGIATYLIYVEYSDYKMLEQLKELGVDEDALRDDVNLIGEGVQQAESNITEKLDYAGDLIDAEKQKIEAEIAERKEQLKEAVIQKISGDNKNEKEDE
ncbi:MAG: hypothetical protein UEY91_06660 [Lachnospiraceae bacterium]|nr:hypothetical protein [Lachnospiraceae bacterium]